MASKMGTDEAVEIVTTMRDAAAGMAAGYRARRMFTHAAVYDEKAAALTAMLDVVERTMRVIDKLRLAPAAARRDGVRV